MNGCNSKGILAGLIMLLLGVLTLVAGAEVPWGTGVVLTPGKSADLRGGDSFLLCSDGLWGYFSDAELAGVVAAFSAREATRVLIERARSRASGEGDNVSVAILKLVEVPEEKKVPRPR